MFTSVSPNSEPPQSRKAAGFAGKHYLYQGPLKPSSLAEFKINLSMQNFIPFLVLSDLNPVLTEHKHTSQMTKIAIVDNSIINVLKLLL